LNLPEIVNGWSSHKVAEGNQAIREGAEGLFYLATLQYRSPEEQAAFAVGLYMSVSEIVEERGADGAAYYGVGVHDAASDPPYRRPVCRVGSSLLHAKILAT
jgi:hypothetical protein